jgi:hypothetical protein
MIHFTEYRDKAFPHHVYTEQHGASLPKVPAQRPPFRLPAGAFLPYNAHTKVDVPDCAHKQRRLLRIVRQHYPRHICVPSYPYHRACSWLGHLASEVSATQSDRCSFSGRVQPVLDAHVMIVRCKRPSTSVSR